MPKDMHRVLVQRRHEFGAPGKSAFHLCDGGEAAVAQVEREM